MTRRTGDTTAYCLRSRHSSILQSSFVHPSSSKVLSAGPYLNTNTRPNPHFQWTVSLLGSNHSECGPTLCFTCPHEVWSDPVQLQCYRVNKRVSKSVSIGRGQSKIETDPDTLSQGAAMSSREPGQGESATCWSLPSRLGQEGVYTHDL